MINFGPVGDAARGGHSSPAFDLDVGIGVLTLTWFGYSRRDKQAKSSFWIAIRVSAICGVFIFAGIAELLR
jgi:hypothetical protein